ncbi:HNH endonuclease signature motif containing protein [Herbiconiux sp.]|uniref:HNH endonuclease signature motif containing protein n=1 Tax=Herbiconiux sp. TaxID=1871186 RepID=UPI0025B8002A|nr:HNH endonuclease signature motif containing protein [Herbiconiux sp.]
MIEVIESDAGTRRRFVAREAFDDDLYLLEDIRRRKSALEGDESVVVARLSRRARGMMLGLDAEESAVCGFARTEEEKRLLVAEVGTTLRVPECTVGSMVTDAETLVTSLPLTLAALQAGEITGRHAHVMVAQCSTIPVEAHGEFEAALLPVAGRLTVAQFTQRARIYRERVHPETPRKRHVEALERRGVWVDPAADGMAQLSVLLPAAEAIAIDDKLDQIARVQRGEGESRTHAQLRCDAAIAMFLDPEGDIGQVGARVRPQVIVTVPVLSLLGHTEEPAELHGYGPIDSVTARRLTANAPSVCRWLTDPITGQKLPVGRESYRVPADLRLALTIEDETCRFPGCRRRAQRCELDHVHAWAHGGETSHANLASLCSKHHHLKHESDWTVEALPGRELRWTSPIGRVHITEPASPAHPPWPERPPSPRLEPSPSPGSEPPPKRPTFKPVGDNYVLPDEPPF